jgi:transposase InsO family protein
MGLMGAPAYFQRVMTTLVLAGLMYNTCEVYMDDIIIFGNTEKEYLDNLKKVLDRLRRHKLTCNPKKSKLGLESVEYVGHIVDGTGISFDRRRLQEFIDLPTPKTKGELKSVLGLGNYLRDNVRDMSSHTAPLTKLLQGYEKKHKFQKIPWTDDLLQQYEVVKQAVNDTQKLFYLDDHSPIHLYTDASDVGIGAYLCQVVDGEERAIAFMSKTLTPTQADWSVPEREAFAIVEAFKKFDYLIRDTHFTLHTDHENLVYIRDTGSMKVLGWKLLVQEFTFTPRFIKGILNKQSDWFSRNTHATMMEEVEEPPPKTDLAACLRFQEQNQFMGAALNSLTAHGGPELMAMMAEVTITETQQAILERMHNQRVGHNGVEVTLQRLRDAGHKWLHMREIVKKYLRNCDTCQKHSAKKMQYDTELYSTMGCKLMATRSVDTLGPFEPDAEGNTYMVVIIDGFSRWLELYAAKSNSALSAARALYAHYGRFGTPERLRSDRGSEFVNALIKEFNRMVGVPHHDLSIAHSHQQNSMVERANLEVRRYLTDVVYDNRVNQSQWSENIPLVMRIYNSLRKEITGVSPAYMLYAGGINLDTQLFKDTVLQETEQDMRVPWQEWMQNRQQAQAVAIEHAQLNTEAHQANHAAEDSGRRTEFPVNSWVLKGYPPSAYGSGKATKQDMNLLGPFRVEQVDGSVYTLFDPASGKTMEPCDIHLLRPYDHDSRYTDPVVVRMKDSTDQYVVERIVSHTGRLNRKNGLSFEVKWVGYPDTTTEPWKNVKDNLALHEYLRSINQAKHIPAKFHEEDSE